MPGYKWLFDNEPLDISDIEAKMKVMQTLGVPYTDAEVTNAKKTIQLQSQKIEDNLHADPDFVKSYEDSKKKAAARRRFCAYASKRNCSSNIHTKIRY
jgi:cytochrome c oxidase cbb3-type subunit I/II